MKTIVTTFAIFIIAAIITTANGQASDFKTYSNFDFLPGNEVLFFDDFSSEMIGDFPVMWNTTGSGEIVVTEMNSDRWFRIESSSMTFLDAGLESVENFTIEFDLVVTKNKDLISGDGWDFQMGLFSSNPDIDGLFSTSLFPGLAGIVLNFATLSPSNIEHTYRIYNNETEKGFEGKNTKKNTSFEIGKKYKLSFWVQKTRLRLYINEEKVFDIQRAFPEQMQIDQIRFWTYEDQDLNANIYISNFRHADATEDNRSKFLTDGKLISYGIYFDSGQDIVKPQSYGAIKEMATILSENHTVKVLIAGHTDSDGNENANLELSKRRAASVKDILVNVFGISADRIETDGRGQYEQVSPNDTPENKAKNRRVEFIRL